MSKRRGTEAVLLVMAWALGVFAYIQVDLAVLGRLPDELPWVAGAAFGVLLVAHLGVRFLAPYADPILLPCVSAINLIGLAMIHRIDLADAARAASSGQDPPEGNVAAQVTWTALAVVLFVTILLVVRDHRRLQRFTYTALFVGLFLLVLPLVLSVADRLPASVQEFVPVGATINGATLWIQWLGFSFQPAELAKIALTIFFAGYLVVTRDSLALVRTKFLGIGFPRGRDLGPLLVAWLISLGVLVFERDLGTSLLFYGLFVTLLYIATQRRAWLLLGAITFAAGATFAYLAFTHVQVRVSIWLDPFGDAANTGYQMVQSMFGFAAGGLLGSGLGQGYPQFVPFAQTDFIVSALGEELGLTGLFALLILYAVVVERGLRASVACRDPFGTLLAAGLSVVLALQVFVTVGGVTRLIPLTGLTTPFLSYGGSALIANWMMVALLLRISDRARRPEPSTTPMPAPPPPPAPPMDEALTQIMRGTRPA